MESQYLNKKFKYISVFELNSESVYGGGEGREGGIWMNGGGGDWKIIGENMNIWGRWRRIRNGERRLKKGLGENCRRKKMEEHLNISVERGV